MTSLWRTYLFVSAHKKLPQVSVTAEYSVSASLSEKEIASLFINSKSHRRSGSSLCGSILKICHSHQFSLLGVCCLPWDFPEVKALLTVGKATRKSSLAERLSEIYQTNKQKITFIISALVKTSFPGRGWGQGEQHLQREKTSVGEWSLIHQCWDWKGRRFKRSVKPCSVKGLSELTAFSYSAYSRSTR